MTDRISQLQAMGYSLSHASMMATVEWALDNPSCRCCWRYLNIWNGIDWQHLVGCPIPALGYAVLREQHWMQKICTNCGDFMEVGDTEELCRQRYTPMDVASLSEPVVR